ncbi:MAG: hypothetical protein P1U89_01160 [Verrucomicrobiales bacterium]|nr:hypothetical protein [Verrucomicrobiales bacterium]
MSENKKSNLIIFGLIVVMVVVYFAFGRKGENPATITTQRLNHLKSEVIAWSEEKGAPPQSLSELGLEESALVDHIGTPFTYNVSGSRVSISTPGADKKPGGIMFKADRVVTFEVNTK